MRVPWSRGKRTRRHQDLTQSSQAVRESRKHLAAVQAQRVEVDRVTGRLFERRMENDFGRSIALMYRLR